MNEHMVKKAIAKLEEVLKREIFVEDVQITETETAEMIRITVEIDCSK